MARAARLQLDPGERRVLVLRRHWWLLMRPALGLVPLLALLPLYATLEYMVPQAGLAQYASLFLTVDLLLCLVVFLKWLAVDFAGWYADSYLITNRRVIERRGVVTVERREASLRSVQESNYTISGPEARFFDYGDLKIQTGGRGSGMVFRQVPHPRRIQTLLSAQARAARQEHQPDKGDAINAALTRIFSGMPAAHDAPTQLVPRVTPLAVRAHRRLSLLPDEAVIHTSRRHPVVLLGAILPPLLLLFAGVGALIGFHPAVSPLVGLCYLCLVVLWSAWGVFDWLDDLYVLTSDRIIELRRMPLFFEMRNVVQLRAVEDVILRISSFGGRLFSVGALTIEMGGASPLRLAAVPHPDRFQRAIFEALDAAVQRDALRDQERLAGTLTEWFDEYHRMQSGPKAP